MAQPLVHPHSVLRLRDSHPLIFHQPYSANYLSPFNRPRPFSSATFPAPPRNVDLLKIKPDFIAQKLSNFPRLFSWTILTKKRKKVKTGKKDEAFNALLFFLSSVAYTKIQVQTYMNKYMICTLAEFFFLQIKIQV